MENIVKSLMCCSFEEYWKYNDVCELCRCPLQQHFLPFLTSFDWKLLSSNGTNSQIEKRILHHSMVIIPFSDKSSILKIVTLLKTVCLTSTQAFLSTYLRAYALLFSFLIKCTFRVFNHLFQVFWIYIKLV